MVTYPEIVQFRFTLFIFTAEYYRTVLSCYRYSTTLFAFNVGIRLLRKKFPNMVRTKFPFCHKIISFLDFTCQKLFLIFLVPRQSYARTALAVLNMNFDEMPVRKTLNLSK